MIYKEEVLHLTIGQKNIELIQISNVDEVFDALISSEKSNPDLIDERIPYWTEIWPSAMAMASYLENNYHLLQGRNVIEIGAGLGLPSLIASRHCDKVLLSDYLDDALTFAKRNAALNNITNIDFQLLDWRNISENSTKYDIVLASDVAYEKRFFEELPKALKKCMHPTSLAILTEPNRLFAKPFIVDLSKHFSVQKSHHMIDHRGVKVEVGIYVLSL